MSITISPETYEWIEEIKEDSKPAILHLWEHCNPLMASMEYARTAATILLASGPDRNGIRGRCHVLLVGAEGTGKSEILDWIADTKENAYASGPSDSEAGLKGNFAHTPPEPGALQLADGGVLCVEELDKFPRNERDALYEAMGKGHYTVNKGDVRNQQFDAECRVIAAANDRSVFRDAFEDRFDFVVNVTEYGKEETEEITMTLLDNFIDGYINDDVSSSRDRLLQYIRFVKAKHTPSMSETARDEIAELYREIIHDKGYAGDIRQKEAYMRVAFTLATLDMDDIQTHHFRQAVALIHGDESPLSTDYI